MEYFGKFYSKFAPIRTRAGAYADIETALYVETMCDLSKSWDEVDPHRSLAKMLVIAQDLRCLPGLRLRAFTGDLHHMKDFFRISENPGKLKLWRIYDLDLARLVWEYGYGDEPFHEPYVNIVDYPTGFKFKEDHPDGSTTIGVSIESPRDAC